MRLLALAASALILSACSQGAETPAARTEPAGPPPVLSGVNLSEPVTVSGTEPFWTIKLTGAELIYEGLDRPEQRAPQPKIEVQGTVATFQTHSAAGTTFDITLTATECSDGMSDRTYPLTAVVKVGEETLMGCASSTAALARASESGLVV